MTLKLTNLKARYSIEINPFFEREKLERLYDKNSMLVLFIDNKGYTIDKSVRLDLFLRLLFELEEKFNSYAGNIFRFLHTNWELKDFVNFHIQDIYYHEDQTREDTFNILVDYGVIEENDINQNEKWITNKLFTTGYMGVKYFEWEDGVIEWHYYDKGDI